MVVDLLPRALARVLARRLKFFVHKSSGIGGTAGLAVGGVVAIFAAPVRVEPFASW